MFGHVHPVIFSWEALFCVLVIQILIVRLSEDMEGVVRRRSMDCYFFFLYIPILTYEIIIARAGSPVAISGHWMLVELNPRYGLFGF